MIMKCNCCGAQIPLLKGFIRGMCDQCNDYEDWIFSNPKILLENREPHNELEAFNYISPVANALLVDKLKDRLEEECSIPQTFFSFYLSDGAKREVFISPLNPLDIKTGGIHHAYIEGHLAVKKVYDKASENNFFCEYVPSAEIVQIPYKNIKKVKIHWINDYPDEDASEPVYGFKAVELCDGGYKAKEALYQLGIQREEKRAPAGDKCYFNEAYMHFCTRIESVISVWKYYSALNPESNTRIVKVKAEGHVFPRYNYQDSWVASRLTIIEEISREQLIDYFQSSPELKAIYENVQKIDHT